MFFSLNKLPVAVFHVLIERAVDPTELQASNMVVGSIAADVVGAPLIVATKVALGIAVLRNKWYAKCATTRSWSTLLCTDPGASAGGEVIDETRP